MFQPRVGDQCADLCVKPDASVVFVFFTGLSVAWYVAWGNKNYVGPVLIEP